MKKRSARGLGFFCRIIVIILICLVAFAAIPTLKNMNDRYIIQNLSYTKEKDGDKIYKLIVLQWVKDIQKAINDNQPDLDVYIEGWDKLTKEQQQTFVEEVTAIKSWERILQVLDRKGDTIPVVFHEKNNCLNGFLRICQDDIVILERGDDVKKNLESYLCPSCHGTGETIMPISKCKACHGTGEILIKCAKYNSESGWEDVVIPCNKCPLHTCKICHGFKYCSIIAAEEWRAQ